MELRSRSLLPQSERSRPQSVDSTLVDWERERLRLDETAPNDPQEQFRSNTHKGTPPQKPMSPRRLDTPDPCQDNDLPLWRSSFQSPERKPQVDFEETFQGFLTHSPMREQERQPYQAVCENSAFRPVMTGQDYMRNSLNSNRENHPTYRAPEPLHVHVPREHVADRHLIGPQFQHYGPYRAPDEVAVRPFDYNRFLPRNYDNWYQFNDIKPRPPSFDGKPDSWEPFLMQIQMMSRSYGWPDYKFRDQLMFALRGEKVQVGKDQEKAQSEKDSHSKNRGGKKPNQQSGTYTMKHIVSRMSSYFPNRWPLSYLNLTKNMKTYIRRQQHKKISNTKT